MTRVTKDSPAYRQAESFGRAMARSGWFVVTGAGEGIMEAAHIGAGRERSIGVNIL
ncbi:MAG: SLOG cluster 4 domain-containing protein [Desulfobacteria bacterium]